MTEISSELIPPSPNSEEYQQQVTKPLIRTAINPIELFEEWLSEANLSEMNDPNAMALATVDSLGFPDVRIVLLKGVTTEGFSFYTNLKSKKGKDIESSPMGTLLFHWKSQRRQVRIRGSIDRLSDVEADTYFASRSRQSQIAAIASNQSSPLPSRHEFEDEVAKLRDLYKDKKGLPRPKHWGGYILSPTKIEFWQDQPYRMHDRLLYERNDMGWTTTRLYP